ncbi:MAG: hypothetical protein JSV36_16175, partial [Anaerolineae bacterium]
MRRVVVSLVEQRDTVKWMLLIFGLLSLSACGGSQAAELAPSNSVAGEATPAPALDKVDETITVTTSPTMKPTNTPTFTPTPSPTPSPTHTLTPTPTDTPTPTPTPVPTNTPTPTPTPTPLHPLAIESMRQQAYPGSDITIEETLEPGSNYDRYLASYLSEGLKIYALLTVPQGEKPESGWPVVIFNHGYI